MTAQHGAARGLEIQREPLCGSVTGTIDKQDVESDGALLHKWCEGRASPFPGRTYSTGSVTGLPRAV